jgi:phage terminase Nu1 subunit (DNA packaging protein)
MTLEADEEESWLEGRPEPATDALTKRELAALTGLAPKKIDGLIRAGMPATPGSSARAGYSFDLKAIFGWFVDGQGATPPDAMTLARQRKAEAEAARIERQNREAAGDLISAKEVRREIAEGMAALRTALLAIPARLADLPPEVQDAVRSEIVAAINSMSVDHGVEHASAS